MKTVTSYDSLFPGRFLKAGEFQGKPVTLTIAKVYLDQLEQDDSTVKPQAVVSFKETKREWALNKTNAQCLVAMWGQEGDDWVGHRVTLHPEQDSSGKSDSGLCIRVKGSPELTAPITATIKLARRKPRPRTLVPTPAKAAAPPAHDEFDESEHLSQSAPSEPDDDRELETGEDLAAQPEIEWGGDSE